MKIIQNIKILSFKLASWVKNRNRATQIAFFILIGYLIMAIFGEAIAPYSPLEFDLKSKLLSPSLNHPFGTDQFGRDIFSRVIVGARSVIFISSACTLVSVSIGAFIGMFSAYFGGKVDEFTMRCMDIIMAFPSLLLALLVMSTLGPSKLNLIISLTFVWAPKTSRIARSGIQSIRNAGFVEVARLRGQKTHSILYKELLPNIRGILSVEFCIRFAYSVLLISSLGFLGMGVQPPTPDWGLMVREARDFISFAPWLALFPAITIGILIVSLNILSDGLWRDGKSFDAIGLK
jgi:peptide/nickel transport system permease protein